MCAVSRTSRAMDLFSRVYFSDILVDSSDMRLSPEGERYRSNTDFSTKSHFVNTCGGR
jgi:hypothetical protein